MSANLLFVKSEPTADFALPNMAENWGHGWSRALKIPYYSYSQRRHRVLLGGIVRVVLKY